MELKGAGLALCVEIVEAAPLGPQRLARKGCSVRAELRQRGWMGRGAA